MLRAVHLRGDLREARERMHDDESALRVSEEGLNDAVRSRDALVLLRIRETLPLDPGHVQHVGVADHFLEAVRDSERETLFLHMLENLSGHLEGRGADERQVGAEFRQGVREGMDGPSVLEVADERDVLSLKGSLLVPDRIQIEEGLRRVLSRAIARVNHGLLREFRGEPGGSLLRMPEHDDVAVGLDHSDGISKSFALLDGGAFGPAEPEDAAAEAGHRALERQAGPSGGLEEQGRENLSV